ncbi:MAG: HAD-IC family P-type ATPase, partial [Firmicutes bacterium]|nr:HAD-IC family P-type ATPase [Bacillota bacterium]
MDSDITRIDASPAEGLTKKQAADRLAAGLGNSAPSSNSRTAAEIVKDNLFTFFNLIFAVLAALLIIAGSFKSLTFLPVVIANIAIGTVQELRAKKTLDKLSLLNEPKARAVRDGEVTELPADQLVLDDIAVFSQGSQICADAVVKSGEVSVNESLITGEAAEIKKVPGDALLSGSFVVSGECRARLEAVGDDSYAARLTVMAKATERKERSEMMRVLNRIVGAVGIIIIPVGLALFFQQHVGAGRGFSESIVSMVAAAIGMIPEGLYFLTSIALAVSTVRLAQRRVMLHDMKSIETLARVDVLCLDKTGTITDNGMTVSGLVDICGRLPEDSGYVSEEALEELLSAFVNAMPKGNITDEALKARFPAGASGSLRGDDAEDSRPEVTEVQPFSSVYKYASAVIGGCRYLLGAPEMVLGEGYGRVRDEVERYSAQGLRTLLLARVDADRPLEMAAGKTAEELALITLENRIRRTAPATFEYFKQQGVDIKIISGDNPLTVSRVAAMAGVEGAERWVDARDLTTPEQISEAASEYTVFGRVLPEQKRELVKALKKAGHTVGMTGDGINDILALKEADCSVAMASGCDAAMQVSQVVLLDSDFSAMPGVVAEGRRVVNNIQRSASLFLIKNIFSLLTALLSIVFFARYPMQPTQVTLVAAFTIGIPGFFLAMAPCRERITGSFLFNILRAAAPAGITDCMAVFGMSALAASKGIPEAEVSTACTVLLLWVGFLMLLIISRPLNAWRVVLIIACMAGTVLAALILPGLFSL